MKKTMLILLVLLALSLGACNAESPTPTPAPVDTVEPLPAGFESLAGTTWMWVDFTDQDQQFEVDGPEYYLMNFKEDGSVNIKADCNRALGEYTDEIGVFSIAVGPVTRALCVESSRSDQFLELVLQGFPTHR